MRWTIEAATGLTEDWWKRWDQLNRTHLEGHPLLDSLFVRALLEHFAKGDIHGATLESKSEAHAMALLQPDGFGKWTVFCPSQSAIGLFVFDREITGNVMLVRELVRYLPGIALALTLPYQDAPYSILPCGHADGVHRAVIGTTIAVSSSSGFDDYWNARKKELRKSIRQRMQRVSNEGIQMKLQTHLNEGDVVAAVDRYGMLESKGWKGKAGTAIHPGNEQGAFYRALLRSFAARDNALVSEAYFEEKLIASRILVSGPRMYVILKTTFDEDYQPYSPGNLHLHLLLRQLLTGDPTRTVEFYTKASADRLAWATERRLIEHATLYRNGLIARAVALRRRTSETADLTYSQPEMTQ